MFSSNTSQVSGAANYIEDVFSTWLYTGNGSTQTINNGIDLAGKGGLVWIKDRSDFLSHILTDTIRGAGFFLRSDTTSASTANATFLSGFNSNGFGINAGNSVNRSGDNYVSWTFREQQKFFDCVTYTGNGTAGRTVAHNLGSVPGTIIVKITSGSGSWFVYHRSLGATRYLILDDTGAAGTSAGLWNNTAPTSTVFSLGNDGSVNSPGQTYVAYLFAHDAGGFGLTGTDNVISCGSYTGNGNATGPVINLGYEPQWLLVKSSTYAGTTWWITDNMRGMPVSGDTAFLRPNVSNPEGAAPLISPTATGFNVRSSDLMVNGVGETYIYIAIRRGPMKTPTTGTSVFSPVTQAANSTTKPTVTTGFPVDLAIPRQRDASNSNFFVDRLRGGAILLQSNSTAAEFNNSPYSLLFDNNTGYRDGMDDGSSYIYWNFRRAPSFFDVVCYTGTGVARTVAHNLGVAPELIITANRSSTNQWTTYCANVCTTNGQYLQLYLADARQNSGSAMWGTPFSGAPNMTATAFSLGTDAYTNNNGANFVAYLFASCPGVSKVGSFTGTGATQVINCGFTGGARFVLIKATSTTGNWMVWDSARGIVAGNDPYLALNSTAAEVTNTDWVDTAASGFELSNAAGNLANSNGVSYIYLAIA